jgi:hypothetical protein
LVELIETDVFLKKELEEFEIVFETGEVMEFKNLN